MNEPDVTCGEPDGRRLLASGLQAALAAAAWRPVAGAWVVLAACGWPGAATAAAVPSASPDAASTATRVRRQGRHGAFTGTPRDDGSAPRRSLPPSPAPPRPSRWPAR